MRHRSGAERAPAVLSAPSVIAELFLLAEGGAVRGERAVCPHGTVEGGAPIAARCARGRAKDARQSLVRAGRCTEQADPGDQEDAGGAKRAPQVAAFPVTSGASN